MFENTVSSEMCHVDRWPDGIATQCGHKYDSFDQLSGCINNKYHKSELACRGAVNNEPNPQSKPAPLCPTCLIEQTKREREAENKPTLDLIDDLIKEDEDFFKDEQDQTGNGNGKTKEKSEKRKSSGSIKEKSEKRKSSGSTKEK